MFLETEDKKRGKGESVLLWNDRFSLYMGSDLSCGEGGGGEKGSG